jgi:hypothetical protein
MPLVLLGARQVGKSWLLASFAEAAFDNHILINLEMDLAVADVFSGDIHPARILSFLETYSSQKITAGKTLIILDEIQACERALTALKYFREQAPEYHIAAAGSLLGVSINRDKFSFPVGNVDMLTLHPMDFEEFLWARNLADLADAIRERSVSMEAMPAALHDRALEAYRHYLVCGGMPAAIRHLAERGSLTGIATIQQQILDGYLADMAKYAAPSDSVRIRAAFNSLPSQLAKDNRKFQYKVVQKGGTAALFGIAIEWLASAGTVLHCKKIEQGSSPLAVHVDNASFKLYMGDTGLLCAKSGLAAQTVLSSMAIDSTFMGALAENYVAQCLAANGHRLHYWESGGIAEIDFLIQSGSEIIPVEVKAGLNTRSRSLNQFVQRYHPPFSIRLSMKNFGFENGIKSMPLYAAFCITVA